jgi:hypothetical protein
MDKIKPVEKKKSDDTIVRDLAKDVTLRKKLNNKNTTVVSLIVFLICTILVMSIFSPTALASEDDSDDDGIDDDTEEHNERGVHIDFELYEIELKSVLLSGDTHHEIEIELDSVDEIKVQMEFSKFNNTPEPEIEVSVEFREIIEFVDSNENGIYDSGDEDVSVYDLREADYNEIEYATRTTSDGETEHILTAQTSDGVFKVVVHAVGSFAVIESGTLSPSEIKIDLIIQNFPYEEDNSQLALFSKLETEEEYEEEHEGEDHIDDDSDDEHKVILTAADAEGYFTWADNADVDGVDTPVSSSTETEEDGDLKLYFVYERGTAINHDPKLGVPFLALSTGPTGSDDDDNSGMRGVTYLAALLVGGLAIGGAVYWRRKKNGYK